MPHNEDDEATSVINAKPVEETSILMEKNSKLKEKLKKLKREAITKEMEVERQKEAKLKLMFCIVLSWTITLVVILTWICLGCNGI